MSQRLRILLSLGVLVASLVIIVVRPLNLGLDLRGGVRIVLEAQDTDAVKVDADAINGVLAIIRDRVDSLGVAEPVISTKGLRQIVVELPGLSDPERALRMVGETAQLSFVEAEWAPITDTPLTPEQIALLGGPEATLTMYTQRDAAGRVISEKPIFLKKVAITGADLKSAYSGSDQYSRPIVNIEFTPEGTRKFHDVTARSVGKPLAILLDGKVISAPQVNEAISGGRAQISGQFSNQEVRDLVIQLKAGALPVPVKIISNQVVGPTLGKDSIAKSRVAGVIGFVLVCTFMILVYRIPGIIASVSLLLYLLVFYAVLKLIGATLTLPGIAGLILTMGIVVDSNILIFERIKEEHKSGIGYLAAVQSGFQRALATVLDANVTTLFATVVLFILGTGPIRGFAVTLTLGILVSMFTAVFLSQWMLLLYAPHAKENQKLIVK
jgi:preprotein translocase subunit SecD